MRVQVVKGAIRFLATVPSTFIHPLDLLVAATRAFMLLSTGNGNERVDLG